MGFLVAAALVFTLAGLGGALTYGPSLNLITNDILHSLICQVISATELVQQSGHQGSPPNPVIRCGWPTSLARRFRRIGVPTSPLPAGARFQYDRETRAYFFKTDWCHATWLAQGKAPRLHN